MATANVDDLLVEFECSVCMDQLKNPKCLHCQHVFCRDCLKKSVTSGRDKANAITCPVCRVVTRLPPGGVDSLKTNPLIKNLLEKLSGLRVDKADDCHMSTVLSTMQDMVDACHDKHFAIQTTHHDVISEKEEAMEILQKLKCEVDQKTVKLIANLKEQKMKLIRKIVGLTGEVEQEMEAKRVECRELEENLKATVESWEQLKQCKDQEILKKVDGIKQKMTTLIQTNVSAKGDASNIVKTACLQFVPNDQLFVAMAKNNLGSIQAEEFWEMKNEFDFHEPVAKMMYTRVGQLVVGLVLGGLCCLERAIDDQCLFDREFTDDSFGERIRDLAVLGDDLVVQNSSNTFYVLKGTFNTNRDDGHQKLKIEMETYQGRFVSVTSFVNSENELRIAVYVAVKDNQIIFIMDTEFEILDKVYLGHPKGVHQVQFDRYNRVCFIDFDRHSIYCPDVKVGSQAMHFMISEEGRRYLAFTCHQSDYVYVAWQNVNNPGKISISKHSLKDGKQIGILLSNFAVNDSSHVTMANWKDNEIAFRSGQNVYILYPFEHREAKKLLDKF